MNLHPLPAFDVVVTGRAEIASDIVLLTLERAGGEALPSWSPGAHIDLMLPNGIERQYSLCSDPADTARWSVAVLREAAGRGGSEYVHSTLAVGETLRVRGPLNHFAFDTAPEYAFVAGGIGITPLLPMIRAAEAAGVPWTLDYAGRSEGSMAFVRELRSDHPLQVSVYSSEAGERLALDERFASVAAGALVYCCGPSRLLDAAQAVADGSGWPAGRLHLERFEAKAAGAPVLADAFDVELELSGMTLTVPPERSILDVVEEAGVLVLSSCREGTCGTCETPVVSGEVDHRDSVLTPEEQADNEVMMICVSRAACPRLVLEL
ncbi:PDR/VanB family oxidoreductase [Subtercola boreus]|uniref:Oxidoreductase n=1 Tax=Subtercola boreus TaxID=120213 RepID=A0A3E0WDR5_9MICO|nr:PDR/VanB family oxidoreductase [Subtercola boreus]RFA21998.1 oxidoreductase [Subtercola boreus]RFA22178.1 oxidoreductase [Subtercola boreus]RFA28040.1 oxidoreductase [Subtercola boreus]